MNENKLKKVFLFKFFSVGLHHQTTKHYQKMENQKVISDKQVKLKIRQLWHKVHTLQFIDDKELVLNVLNELGDLENQLDKKIYYSEINTF